MIFQDNNKIENFIEIIIDSSTNYERKKKNRNMPKVGLEPTTRIVSDSKSDAFTNFAILAKQKHD